jgi:hypothetical protein
MKRHVVLGALAVLGLGAIGAGIVAYKGQQSPTPIGRDVSDGPVVRPLAGPAAVTDLQLADFVTEIERLINGAAERIIAQGSEPAATPGPFMRAPGRRVPAGEPLEREFDVATAGQSGRAQATGLAFTRPWPARYDMSLLLEDFTHTGTLTAAGGIQYNFVHDDRAVPAVGYGLFRARLALTGRFNGDVDLHGEMAAGKIVSLVVLTGERRERFTFGGREPRPFVAYVATVAGTGGAGNADGPALEAQFNEPAGVIVDRNGRVFIADTGNRAVRELSRNGEVSTLSTAFDEPWDLGFDGLGLLVVSDRAPSTKDNRGPISRVLTGGTLKGTVIRTIEQGQNDFAGFPLCNNYSCDGRTPIARMQYAGGIDAQGGIVMLAQWALPTSLRMVTPDGTAMTLRSWSQSDTSCANETSGGPLDVARGLKGEVYFTTGCNAVSVLRADGTLEAIAGTPQMSLGFADGVGRTAKFSYPYGLVFDGEHLFLTERSSSKVRRVNPATGDTLRIAGCLPHTEGFDCADEFGFRDGPGDYALLNSPKNLAVDPWGDLYIADTGNHAIRLVRIANDPERKPVIARIQPLALQQGAQVMLTIGGRDLGLTRTVELGAGMTAEVLERSAKRLKVRVQVAEDAQLGAHSVAITTPFGRVTTPDGMALNVIGERASRAQVSTMAGTGDWSVGINDIVPAEQAQFAFPGGLAAIDKERLLVADPLEHRIRMITTKDGAAQELLEIATYQAGGSTGLAILQGIEGLEGLAGKVLGLFGADNFAEAPRAELLKTISAGLDKICDAAGSDCKYMALPWAGFAAGPGDSGGFRLGARLFLPTDVAVIGDGQFLIADTGNERIKTVGIDFSGTEPEDAPYQVGNTDELQDYPLAVASMGDATAVAATSTESTLAKVTLRDGSSVLSAFAGVRNAFRCTRADGDVRQPLGVPMGIATGKSGTFIADPYCATIWKLDANGQARDIRGDLKLPLNPLPACTDGPLAFATFGAPMDVAVQSDGTIWVADSWCHSIRVIKDRFADAEGAAAELGKWAAGVASWFDADAASDITALVGNTDLGSLDPARWWVTTVAGSADGEPGFRDGAASEALFNAPVAIAVAEDEGGGKPYVFVADAGNKRIRLIDMSARVETTTRVPPAEEAPAPFTLPGPNDPPLSPLAAVNYLIAWVYHGTAAQYAADATDAILAFDDDYLAREEQPGWELSLQFKNVKPDISIASPPGFTGASRDGFAMAAPLVGTWRAGFTADLIGKAVVNGGGVQLFSWTPEVLDFGLGVRDLRLTANVDLDPARAVPQLESAAVHVQALLYGTGAVAFNRPVDLEGRPRDGALELRGQLTDERLDLGGLSARLDADLVLTLRPTAAVIPVVIDPVQGTLDPVADDLDISSDPLVDERIPATRVTVAIQGTMKTALEGAGDVSVPLSARFDVNVPSTDTLDVVLRGLERPIPRIWGEDDVPPGFEIESDEAEIPSPAEFADAATDVERAFRAGHAPLGVVMSRLRPPPSQPSVRRAGQELELGQQPSPNSGRPRDEASLADTLAQAPVQSIAFPDPIWMGEEDSAIWTAHYLAATSYRYAAESLDSAAGPSDDARAGVELALGGIEALFDVTEGAVAVAGELRAPVRAAGLLSRTLMSDEAEFEGLDFEKPLHERECYYLKTGGSRPSAIVAGRASNVRYGYGCSNQQPVSRDQYIGVMMGLTVANRLVDDPDVKARTQRLLERAIDFLVDNEWNIHLPPEERIQTNFIGNFEKQLAILRIGKTLNPKKYAVLYDYLAQASELAWLPAWVSTVDIRSQYYKFNLLQSGLVAALLLEDDPALRANYLAVMDLAWGAVGHHRNAYFDLLRVLVRSSEAERTMLLDMKSVYDSKSSTTLRQEITAVLGEWIARRENDRMRSTEGLLLNRVPDVDFIVGLWPAAVGEYFEIDGGSRVLALKAMPVDKRPSRESMDFIWQRQPFEVAMNHKIDRKDTPSETEILEKGQDELWREAPGVDYLIAYWLARHLRVLEAQ